MMIFVGRKYILVFYLLLVVFNGSLDGHVHEDTEREKEAKAQKGIDIAMYITVAFIQLFEACLGTSMQSKKFSLDDMQKYVMQPARTTVGFLPKFTGNRKFFANLITTAAFKEMLVQDKEELRKNYVRKMKYCDSAVMEQSMLQDFYEREVDQSKL